MIQKTGSYLPSSPETDQQLAFPFPFQVIPFHGSFQDESLQGPVLPFDPDRLSQRVLPGEPGAAEAGHGLPVRQDGQASGSFVVHKVPQQSVP